MQYVLDLIPQYSPAKPFVILVDHGTPLPEVNLVREEIGYILEEKLGNHISGFSTACMERRRGLNTILMILYWSPYLSKKASGSGCVILAQLFLAPGRHAGPKGDIAQICAPFLNEGMKIARTPTLKSSIDFEILAERLKELEV